MKEYLFHILLKWRLENKASPKQALAGILNKCGLFKQAVQLDPHSEKTTPPLYSSSYILFIVQ